MSDQSFLAGSNSPAAIADGKLAEKVAWDSLSNAHAAFLTARYLASEFLGTAFLLMAIVGSGVVGAHIGGGNIAITLIVNPIATGAALVVLISVFGPISGAHFNPAVTLFFGLRREMPLGLGLAYVAAQLLGATVGVWSAHAMFAMPVFEVSEKLRDGPGQLWSECVATFGLMATIAGAIRSAPQSAPYLVGLYITAASWFTASTSFANPAVVIARSLTNSFAGIAPSSTPTFVAAQLGTTVLSFFVLGWLLGHKPQSASQGMNP